MLFIKRHHKLENWTFIIITPETAKKYKLSYEYDIQIDMNIFDNNKKLIRTAKNIWLVIVNVSFNNIKKIMEDIL
jgi:hypothetical protein